RSANVYAAGALDDLIVDALLPLWRDAPIDRGRGPVALWWLRYARRGEHLKLRLHAVADGVADDALDALGRALEARISQTFTALGEPRKPEGRSPNDAPPVDREDADPAPAEDRTLLWTHYQRSPVSLGAHELMQDDAFCARMAAAYAAAADVLFTQLDETTTGHTADKKASGDDTPRGGRLAAARLGLLFRLAAAGLAATDAGGSADAHTRYLTYHRDWLLRFLLPRPDAERTLIVRTLTRFDQEIEALPDARRDALLATAHNYRPGTAAPDDETPAMRRWRDAMRALVDRAGPLCRHLEATIDPYADDPIDSAIFNLLNGVANLLGVRTLQEAYVYHLLLHASATTDDRPG
ncbi:MAG: lantibiotic dehydratase C-terminal domain-containing protein, partial [Acidobacteriota bacterium]